MQHDHLYLQDILDAAETVANFVARTDRETFLANPEKQSAVAFQFMVIGEAVRNLSDELKDRYPEIPWSNARRLRNLIAHHYLQLTGQLSGILLRPRFLTYAVKCSIYFLLSSRKRMTEQSLQEVDAG